MLQLLGLRTGRRLLRPLFWTAGGLALTLLAGAAAAAPAAGATTLPLAGARLTQPFGCTPVTLEPADPACASGHFHSGVDLAAPLGTPVRSVCGGAATPLSSTTGYGLHVVVSCGEGVQMLYGHLSAIAIAGPAVVAAGQLLGRVGSTGLSTGPHLHFEVRRDGTAVDPLPWLPAYAAESN